MFCRFTCRGARFLTSEVEVRRDAHVAEAAPLVGAGEIVPGVARGPHHGAVLDGVAVGLAEVPRLVRAHRLPAVHVHERALVRLVPVAVPEAV